jgi:hypothetical protein
MNGHQISTCTLCTMRVRTAPEFVTVRPYRVSLVKAYAPVSTYRTR